ncbi:hypothetical protein [Halalkalicoccus ordinarius]|uniref:hypothetical protein n=1 Tax=Halalkalicoccus ordinarius TaxID=3116651 RepID=UPI00300F79A4
MANETAIEFIEEWQLGIFFIIGCFIGAMVGLFLFAHLGWDTVIGSVLGTVFTFLIASYVLYSR